MFVDISLKACSLRYAHIALFTNRHFSYSKHHHQLRQQMRLQKYSFPVTPSAGPGFIRAYSVRSFSPLASPPRPSGGFWAAAGADHPDAIVGNRSRFHVRTAESNKAPRSAAAAGRHGCAAHTRLLNVSAFVHRLQPRARSRLVSCVH